LSQRQIAPIAEPIEPSPLKKNPTLLTLTNPPQPLEHVEMSSLEKMKLEFKFQEKNAWKLNKSISILHLTAVFLPKKAKECVFSFFYRNVK
jgi:hypothetical protein